jgi:hypothetical protein
MKRSVWLFLAVTSLALILAVERGRRGRLQEDYDAGMRAVAEGRHADAEGHLKAAVEAATRSYKADDSRLAVYLTGLAVAYWRGWSATRAVIPRRSGSPGGLRRSKRRFRAESLLSPNAARISPGS